jgi:hypothetical protein
MIFILEISCCPKGHVLDSVAWDDETHRECDAVFRLGQLVLPVLPVCAVCGSTSTRLVNRPTACATTAEAAGSRNGCAILS